MRALGQAVAIGLLISASARFACAEDVGNSMTAPGLQTGGAVRIELIAQPREVELPTRFHVALRLVNTTATPVIFRTFDLKPLEEPGGLVISKDSKECSQAQQTTVASNQSLTITCELHSKGFDDSVLGYWGVMLGSWSLLTLQPGDYGFVATAEVRDTDGTVSTMRSVTAISKTFQVRMRPTVWQVCLGALLGSLLLVVFAFSSPKTRALVLQQDRLKSLSGLRLWLFEPMILWLGASMSAAVFIFLTYRMKDVSGPFTVTVNDFYGGVVIGLFGLFIANRLAGKLFGEGSKDATALEVDASLLDQRPVQAAHTRMAGDALDGCAISVVEPTPDTALPPSRGGVAS